MKKTLFSLTLLAAFFTSFAQANKPEANSFGIQYGVNFNGTIGQAVQLSGWLKNGIEIRGAMNFSYVNNQTNTVNSSNYVQVGNGSVANPYRYLPELQVSSSSNENLTLSQTISVVKHLPTKNNLDFYIGGGVTYGLTMPTAWSTNTSTYSADTAFYSYSSTRSKSPLTFTWGLSILGGANFFFYKNLALGADFGLGFTASNSKGNYMEHDIRINSGSANYDKANYDNTIIQKLTNNKYNLTFAGNAGLHLTYYLKVKKKETSVAKL